MKLIKQVLSHVPTKLPVGLTEFNEWADSIIELSGNYADIDSMKYAIASNLIHLPHTKSKVPKAYFVNTLRKAAANQVASQVFQDIKLRQAEEAAKKQAEATALKEVANGETTNPSTT